MITDKDTDFVYFSSLIKELDQYTPFWKRLNTILTEKKSIMVLLKILVTFGVGIICPFN